MINVTYASWQALFLLDGVMMTRLTHNVLFVSY